MDEETINTLKKALAAIEEEIAHLEPYKSSYDTFCQSRDELKGVLYSAHIPGAGQGSPP